MKGRETLTAFLTIVIASSAFLITTASATWQIPTYPVSLAYGTCQPPFVITLSGISGDYSVTNGVYTGYCIELGVPAATYKPYTAMLMQTDGAGHPWNEINWLLNGYPDSLDLQMAIWRLQGNSEETIKLNGWTYTVVAENMYKAALAHSSFIPSACDKVGVRCLLDDAQDQLIVVEPQPPTGSIVINDGAATTSDASVTLELAATGYSRVVTQMRFSNLHEAWTAWEPYATSRDWVLAPGAGTKTVFAQFKDDSGLESAPYSDTIMFAPLVNEETYDVWLEGNLYVVVIRTNSSISEFSFNEVEKRIRLGVEGAAETVGFCDITIPAALMPGDLSIFMDGVLLAGKEGYVQVFNGTHYIISMDYPHSVHTINIVSTSAVPEFPSSLLVLMAVPLFSGTLVLRKRLLRTRN